MGFLKNLTGGPDKKLLQTGLLGRGIIIDYQMTGTTFSSGNGLVQRQRFLGPCNRRGQKHTQDTACRGFG